MARGRPPLPIGTWGEVRTKRSGTGWYAVTNFRDADGVTRRVQRHAPTKGAARNRLLEDLADRSTEAGGDVTSASTVAATVELWLAEVDASDRALSTRRRYREIAEGYLVPRIGQRRLYEMSVSACERFIFGMIEAVSLSTAHKCRDVLSLVIGFAVRHNALDRNPVAYIKQLPSTSVQPRAVSLELLASIRQSIARWERGLPVDGSRPDKPRRGRPPRRDLLDVFDLLLGTGARIGEVLALRWSDVDFDERVTVTVKGTIVYDPSQRPTIVRQDNPKTDAGYRRLVLPAFAAATLLRKRVHDPATVDDIVFPSTAGRWRDPGQIRKWWRAVRDELGPEYEWITPHSFRRTVGTLVDAEASLDAAAAQLGHGNTRVTARHYVERVHDAPDLSTVLGILAPGVELASFSD